jgi:hypothetical protein
VRELNAQSGDRGQWSLKVHPGCNVATVVKYERMTKDRGRWDRKFLETLVDPGDGETTIGVLYTRLREGPMWTGEDYSVIFYRLVCVLADTKTTLSMMSPEFGGRDNVVGNANGVVKRAVTNAYELGFVVMHEGRRYIEVMDEHPMVAGLEYDESTGFGAPGGAPIKEEKEGQSRNMVQRVEVSKVKDGKTKEDPKEKTKKVCFPVLVSGETLFLVPDIETMPVVRKTLGERTPLQVPGVQLAELAACKHVKVYHPEGWPRREEEHARLVKFGDDVENYSELQDC